jgi:hypothetical protein
MFRSVFILLILAICASAPVSAQEFTAKVTLNRSQITNTSLDYLEELVPLIENYINQYKWTEFTFEEHERLRLNLQVILNTETNNTFDATLILSSERPIYNTLQLTPLIAVNDESWRFVFNRNQNVIHDPQVFNDIASVLDFYAYFVMALDLDSFAELGGSEYYRKAQGIVDVAQSSGSLAWQSGGSSRRNRFYLINGFTGTGAEGLRKAIYRYHRHGLDLFTQDPEQARKNILEALTLIRDAKRATTETYVFDLFFDSKYREIASVFLDADATVRLEAYNLLLEIDPSHIGEYDKLQ